MILRQILLVAGVGICITVIPLMMTNNVDFNGWSRVGIAMIAVGAIITIYGFFGAAQPAPVKKGAHTEPAISEAPALAPKPATPVEPKPATPAEPKLAPPPSAPDGHAHHQSSATHASPKHKEQTPPPPPPSSPSEASAPPGTTFNVSSTGQQNGTTAGIVNNYGTSNHIDDGRAPTKHPADKQDKK
jgi:hypothetical protein